jgi:hypothetical protein
MLIGPESDTDSPSARPRRPAAMILPSSAPCATCVAPSSPKKRV